MVFYHKGLRTCKIPLPFVACDRKAAILRVQIWSAHESDVVGLLLAAFYCRQFRTKKTPIFRKFSSGYNPVILSSLLLLQHYFVPLMFCLLLRNPIPNKNHPTLWRNCHRSVVKITGPPLPCRSLVWGWDSGLSSSPVDADQYDAPGQAGGVL